MSKYVNVKNVHTAVKASKQVVGNIRGTVGNPKMLDSSRGTAIKEADIEAAVAILSKKIKEKQIALSEFNQQYRKWEAGRKKLIDHLTQIAETLHNAQFNDNICQATGSSAGIVGGTAVVVGIAAAPFTGGASLALTAGGAMVGTAGGVVSLGSALAKIGITKSKCNEATEQLEADQRAACDLNRCLTTLLGRIDSLNTAFEENDDVFSYVLTGVGAATTTVGVGLTAKSVKDGFSAYKAMASNPALLKRAQELSKLSRTTRNATHLAELKNIKSMFKGSAATMSATGRAVSGVLSVAFIGLDIWSLVNTAIDLNSGSKSEAGTQLESTVATLGNEMRQMEGIYNNLQKQS